MSLSNQFNVVVIGGGTAGISAARTASRRGLSVALIDATRLGGEALWWTCLPTKALLESAHAYYRSRHDGAPLEYGRVLEERRVLMQRFTAQISAATLTGEGITCFHGKAAFVSPHSVRVGDHQLHADHIIIAVGAFPCIPPIPGLEQVKYLTYMHAVNLPAVPKSLAIIGGGPVGCEFAQLFSRFGATVTMVEQLPCLLNGDDAEAGALALRILEADGVRVLTNTRVTRIDPVDGRKQLTLNSTGREMIVPCDEILIVTGRRPHLDGLNLEAAGLSVAQGNLVLQNTLQTSVPHIWACGDAAGQQQFRHLAEYHGEHVGRNLGVSTPEPVDDYALPHTTFLDPEIAGVGLTEAQAAENYNTIAVKLDMESSDRAWLAKATTGYIKLVVNRADGQILGGHIAGPLAGEIIHEIALAMRARIPVKVLGDMPRVYPSLYDPLRRVAQEAEQQRANVII